MTSMVYGIDAPGTRNSRVERRSLIDEKDHRTPQYFLAQQEKIFLGSVSKTVQPTLIDGLAEIVLEPVLKEDRELGHDL